MKEKIPYYDVEFVRCHAEQLENMIKQRSHHRRILIKFIRLNRKYFNWWDRYISKRSDTTLLSKFRHILTAISLEEKTPK